VSFEKDDAKYVTVVFDAKMDLQLTVRFVDVEKALVPGSLSDCSARAGQERGVTPGRQRTSF